MKALVLAAALLLAVPFWGAHGSQPAETPPESLHPGQFVWSPDVAESGPVTMIVSIDEQRAYVYRNGLRIAYTTVSTGRKGYATPTGIFTILQKDPERLSWDGVALHAGGLPGYPPSHGCVHLPSQFAEDLFAITPMGMTVVVVGGPSAPTEVEHPTDFEPIDPRTGIDDDEPRLLPNEEFHWEPARSPGGPVSILVSSADQRAIVFRNGIEIGRSRITLTEPGKPLGSHAFILVEKSGPNALRPRWIGVGLPGYEDARGRALTSEAAARVVLPDEFRVAVQPLLEPGTTVLITDAAILPETTGTRLQVADSDPPP